MDGGIEEEIREIKDILYEEIFQLGLIRENTKQVSSKFCKRKENEVTFLLLYVIL